jgi:hypothetical protein
MKDAAKAVQDKIDSELKKRGAKRASSSARPELAKADMSPPRRIRVSFLTLGDGRSPSAPSGRILLLSSETRLRSNRAVFKSARGDASLVENARKFTTSGL